MYTVAELGTMIADGPRLKAYAEALETVIRPDSVVVDIGAGTGILSLLACRFGARRVYAIEPSNAVHLLAQAARDNGYADRIEILERRSTEVTLPERADVIVSDLRGVLFPYESHFADVMDARSRLLAQDGHLIPNTDLMFVGVVSASASFEQTRRVWESAPFGLDIRSALAVVDNTPRKERCQPEQMLSEPVRWARIHYPTLAHRRLRGSGTLAVTRDGMSHGLLVWFDTELVEGIGYSNAPGTGRIYGQMLFPWSHPVSLQAGDTVRFDIRVDPFGTSCIWTWTTEVRQRSAPDRVFQRMRHSTFQAYPLSGAVHTRAPAFVPSLSAAGDLTLCVLEGLRAKRSIGELARELFAGHVGKFRSQDEAQGFVSEVVELFCAS
jgi:protein arginine N-methyltransferase 1